jgi:hypothetical protein
MVREVSVPCPVNAAQSWAGERNTEPMARLRISARRSNKKEERNGEIRFMFVAKAQRTIYKPKRPWSAALYKIT